MRTTGFSRADFAILAALTVRSPQSYSELVDSAPLPPSTLTERLGRLARQGLLDRDTSKTRLTPSAAAFVPEVYVRTGVLPEPVESPWTDEVAGNTDWPAELIARPDPPLFGAGPGTQQARLIVLRLRAVSVGIDEFTGAIRRAFEAIYAERLRDYIHVLDSAGRLSQTILRDGYDHDPATGPEDGRCWVAASYALRDDLNWLNETQVRLLAAAARARQLDRPSISLTDTDLAAIEQTMAIRDVGWGGASTVADVSVVGDSLVASMVRGWFDKLAAVLGDMLDASPIDRWHQLFPDRPLTVPELRQPGPED